MPRHLLLLLAAACLIAAGFTIHPALGLFAASLAAVGCWWLLAPEADR